MRAPEFNSSGNVEAVVSELKLELAFERVELMENCCAMAKLESQPLGLKPRLSLLMISAA
jgi:hypothetical protein